MSSSWLYRWTDSRRAPSRAEQTTRRRRAHGPGGRAQDPRGDADDGAAVLLGQVQGVPPHAGKGGPERALELAVAGVTTSGPKSLETSRATVLPMAASQLIELSNRDAVEEIHVRPVEAGERVLASPPAGVDGDEPLLYRAGQVAVPHPAARVEQELVVGRDQDVGVVELRATGRAPAIWEASTNTMAPTWWARAPIAAMSERWPVADCTPLKATSLVPPSIRLPTWSGSSPPCRKGTCRTSYPLCASWRHGKWFELYSLSPMTTFSPCPAMSSWAATSPAADDTEGISARSAGSAPISRGHAAGRSRPARRGRSRGRSRPTRRRRRGRCPPAGGWRDPRRPC